MNNLIEKTWCTDIYYFNWTR